MKLEKYLINNKIEQKKMAFDLGISRGHLYLIRTKKRFPSAQLAIKIENYTKGLVSRYELRKDAESIWGVNKR